MIRTLLSLLRPLHSIAKDLNRMADLYELDLRSRTPPITRITEELKEGQLEVMYMGDLSETKKESGFRKFLGLDTEEEQDV